MESDKKMLYVFMILTIFSVDTTYHPESSIILGGVPAQVDTNIIITGSGNNINVSVGRSGSSSSSSTAANSDGENAEVTAAQELGQPVVYVSAPPNIVPVELPPP
ncbi:hypothetical protein MKW92_029041, partial [Papaver armeniacum]